jgi:2'-5' RNA ligase
VGESAINIHVPELSDVLRPWRKATEAKGVPPHVTLLYPWRQAPLRAVDIDQLRAAIANTRTFTIRFVAIERFPARALYLKIEEESQIRALMRKLHATFSDTPPYGGVFSDVIPHLTIATAETDAEPDRVLPHVSQAAGASSAAINRGASGYRDRAGRVWLLAYDGGTPTGV